MTDPRLNLCKPLIGAMLLLWCMGSVSGAADLLDHLMPRIGEAYPCKNRHASDVGPAHGWAGSNQDPPPRGLAYTADELRDRIRRIPATPAATPEAKLAPRRSLGAVKGGAEDYVTANCADLRLTLVQLLRKVNALKKRENSVFSGLSETEKQELAELNEKLSALMTVLRARCSAPNSE